MPRDDPGELRRIADALFRALDSLGPDGHPDSLDLSSCDALTPETDSEHLILQGKLCAQRLYSVASGRPHHEQDAVIILVATLNLVVHRVVDGAPGDSDKLRRLIDGWERLQNLTMELEHLHAGREP